MGGGSLREPKLSSGGSRRVDPVLQLYLLNFEGFEFFFEGEG